MKKHFLKRALSLLLLVSLSLSLCTISSLATDTDGSILQHKIEQSLLSILSEPEIYGLNGVNMSSLYLGDAISAYEVTGETLAKLDMVIYPIFDGTNRVVLIAAVTYLNNEPIVSLSNTFTDDLCAFSPDERLTFIYDNSGVFLFNGQKLISIEKVSECAGMNRGSAAVLDQAQLLAVEGASLQPRSALSVPGIMPLGLHGSDDEEISLTVQKIRQKTRFTCWAAAMASMLNYLRTSSGIYLSEDSIIKAYYGNNYDGESSPPTQDLISNVNFNYNAHLTYVGNTANARSDIWDALRGTTVKGEPYPVYGDFDGPGNGHAMVIRGMVGWELFSVMDPQYAEYSTGSITGNTFSITLPHTGNTFTLRYYAYKNQ